ncbi:protein translocase subunit SecF [Pelagibacteraceae bacterium]|jgi:preprotein translocase SecF subunit|nr:protein translocase subunit SecF [Candidatus Pelagibacter bacterium]MDC1079422.1 protein translocase subunit SecF [Pelagibacteraceae bacterium]|tara:strand:- start:314 stop:1216 length:903 start_codon:yes stop_codon:yes gene_type:complete
MNNKFNFSSKFKIANSLSLLLFILSILFIFFKGLNYGIDFKGGTLIELRSDNTDASTIRTLLNNMDLGDVNVKKFGQEGDYLIKVEQKEDDNNKIIPKIKKNLSDNLTAEVNFRRVENVGPKVSSELLQSGIIAISLSLAAMLFYIWIRFEWQFSIGSIIALFHDVVITLGIFSVLSLEINLSIIAAALTIVGYSMNDTVVIYDRIRENLNKYNRLNISEIADLSINDTLARTIITSATTLLALLSIFILGGEILRGFSFAMILGVVIGTYSSIFVASPMLKFFKVTYKTLEKEEEKIVP